MSECFTSGWALRSGYGRRTIGGKAYQAHRLAYAWHHGVDPGPLCVMHTCDHPACVNPEHLVLGTHQENMEDRQRKGRSSNCGIGGGQPRAVTVELGVLISAATGTCRAVGGVFGVSAQTVSRLRRGVYWLPR